MFYTTIAWLLRKLNRKCSYRSSSGWPPLSQDVLSRTSRGRLAAGLCGDVTTLCPKTASMLRNVPYSLGLGRIVWDDVGSGRGT
jgi:hypothetical protein